MNDPLRNAGISKLALCLLALAASIPASGVSAADLPVKATCSAPDHLAVIKSAMSPEYPSIAKAEGFNGSTRVRVSLDRSGTIKSAAVAQSSGFASLDREALVSVRSSKYDPETVSCRPVAGDYFVDVSFEE